MMMPPRLVVPAPEALEPLRGHRREAPLAADDMPSKRLARIIRLLQHEHEAILRILQRFRQLLQNHAALQLQILGGEGGAPKNIGEQLQRKIRVGAENARCVGCGCGVRRGVDPSSDIFNRFGDFRSGPARRALEGHMLQKMSDSVLSLSFGS